MGKKITVMLTGSGGSGTIYILKNLKRYNTYKTIAVDMNPYAAGLYVADESYCVVHSQDEKYLECISRIIRSEKVDVLIPLIDEELIKVFDLKDEFPDLKIVLPNKEFVVLTLDKFRLSRELMNRNIPVPETYTLKEFKGDKDKSFPVVIKPNSGRGSRDVGYISNEEELGEYSNRTKYKESELIVQRQIKGKEFTTSVVVTKNNDILSIVPKEAVLKTGITKIGITRNNSWIIDSCRKLVMNLNPCGPFNVQMILEDGTTVPYVIEINPRFSTTVSLTIESGVDEVDLSIRDQLNIPFPPLNSFKEDLVMIRYEDHLFTNEKDILGK